MLGKGLESLIPAQGNDAANAPQNGAGDRSAEPRGFVPAFPKADPPIAPVAVPAVAPMAESPKESPPMQSPKPEILKAAPDEIKPEDYVFHIEVAKISPNPRQPRRNFDEVGIRELAASIREFGFIQPLIVTRVDKETAYGVEVRYELIAGERRLLAAKMLGLEVVPAIIREVDLEIEKLQLAMIENIQRENLNPIETGRAFQHLQEEFRMTQREIASKLGKSRESVANTMRLLDLPPYIQEALEKNQISESHGRLLLGVEDLSTQKKLFEDIMSQHLTTRDVKERVKLATAPVQKERKEVSPELKMMEDRLSSELGTPVKIEKGENTGKITITFYSEEELESIVKRIGADNKKDTGSENFHL